MVNPLQAVPEPRDRDSIAAYVNPYRRYLRSEGKAEGTIAKYLMILGLFEAHLLAAGHTTRVAEIQKPDVQDFIVATLETKAPSTAVTRFYALIAFFNFLHEDEEIRWHPMAGMSPPPAPVKPVPVLASDTVEKLLKTCKTNGFEDRRDAAIIMMFYDTGARASELTHLTLDEVIDGAAQVLGKGSKVRSVFFGSSTARVLDRYLRVRDRHKDADLPNLWLGKRGAMTRWGIRDVLERRCDAAGIERIHPHQFRHTFAHEWLADGGQETDLMRLAGWSSRSMLSRYAASAADARAKDSYRKRQSPGDKLKRGGR